jgi:hypothetical protein
MDVIAEEMLSMIELTGIRDRLSRAFDRGVSYKVQVCGEYVSLWQDGRKSCSYLDKARDAAKRYETHEEPSSISIHAFDRHDIFSHVVG